MAVYDTPLQAPADNRLVTSTDWTGYLKFLEAIGESSLRATYDRGRLEIMTPSVRHEQRKSALAHLVEVLLSERALDFQAGGTSTLKRQDLDRGLEPDECYWIEHWQALQDDYDITRDPPPDLVLEVEVSRTAVSRLGIYRALAVPEVWRYRSTDRLEVWRLQDGDYVQLARSPHFPDVDPEILTRFVERSRTVSLGRAVREFRTWLADLE